MHTLETGNNKSCRGEIYFSNCSMQKDFVLIFVQGKALTENKLKEAVVRIKRTCCVCKKFRKNDCHICCANYLK